MTHRMRFLAFVFIVIGGTARAADPEVLDIGIADSLVSTLPPTVGIFLHGELTGLVKDFTGYNSRIRIERDSKTGRGDLNGEQSHFILYPGIRFAWAQSRDSELRPLVVGTFKQARVQAILVAKKGAQLSGLADLRGKDINLLSREHCRLFAAKVGVDGKFCRTIRPTSKAEEALDDVLLNKTSASVVDNVSLDIYKDIHPGRFDRLQILSVSESFPAPVIAYRRGSLSDTVLTKFRDGIVRANESERGRAALAVLQIFAFENPRADHSTLIDTFLKSYPPPE